MNFTSFAFIFFVTFTWVLSVAAQTNMQRLALLSLASLLFYASWGMVSLVSVLGASGLTYFVSLRMEATNRYRLYWAGLGISGLVTLLLVNRIYSSVSSSWIIILGTSYYSLQAIGYLVDLAQQRLKPERNLLMVFLFLTYFPQALAGPINRAEPFFSQLLGLRPQTRQLAPLLKQILYGFFCKLILADQLGFLVDPILDHASAQGPFVLFLGSLGYALQLYFDFWGYTLIVTGISEAFGLKMISNFNYPYLATSFREFWQRWHISLSSWFRDYVYKPLGGNRTKGFPVVVLITFLLSGLWHGFALNFVVWGGFHAILYGTETWFKRLNSHSSRRIKPPLILKRLIFWFILLLSWLIFRGVNWDPVENGTEPYEITLFQVCILVAALMTCIADHLKWIDMVIKTKPRTWSDFAWELTFINMLLISLFVLGDLGKREFIYFNF
jgi:alginate O-acetyltransferase complex protein AlgI